MPHKVFLQNDAIVFICVYLKQFFNSFYFYLHMFSLSKTTKSIKIIFGLEFISVTFDVLELTSGEFSTKR